MKLKNIMNQFITGTIDISEFLKNSNVLTQEETLEIYDIKETTFMDKRMHGIILLWLLKYQFIHLDGQENNPYLSYLYDLIDDEMVTSVKFLSIKATTLIAKVTTNKNNIYILINHSQDEISFHLPKEIANQSMFCFNCNDDLLLKNNLDIPEYSFYALKKSIQKQAD